jgi:hypothetical protein
VLAETLADDGVSGGNRERLERLAERVKITGAPAIVVYHMDRFAQDLAATLDFILGSPAAASSSTLSGGERSKPIPPRGSS